MKKYVVTDSQGNAPNRVKLASGKFTLPVGTDRDVFVRLSRQCCDSPLQAVLTCPNPTNAENTKVFLLNRWETKTGTDNNQGYTIVKEVPVPVVSLEQKVAFAIAAVSEIYRERDFVAWADDWLSGKNRTAESAQAMRKSAERDLKAEEDLKALASTFAAAGFDPRETERRKDLEQRAVYAARMAELVAATQPDEKAIAEAIIKATEGIGIYGEDVDLGRIAERVHGTN